MIFLFICLFLLLLAFSVLGIPSWQLWSKVAEKMGRVQHSKRRFFLYTVLSPTLLLWSVLLYGYYVGRWQYDVREWHFHHAELPEGFEGYRIAHISDLHLETFYDNPAHLDTLIRVINAQRADVIFFTGDLVSYNTEALIHFLPQLKQLRARDGVFSILGNHDYGYYDKQLDSIQKEEVRRRLIDIQRNELKWNVLLNEHQFLYRNRDSIAVLGIENQSYGFRAKIRRGNLDKARKGTDDTFQLLLSHDPSQWDQDVLHHTSIPLTLSGHTHAMQFRVADWTPCRWLFKRSDGAYQEGNQHLYVNIGLGQLLPFRIGAASEITLITLHRSDAQIKN